MIKLTRRPYNGQLVRDVDFAEILQGELQRDAILLQHVFSQNGWTSVPTVTAHADPLKVQVGTGLLCSNGYLSDTESGVLTVGESTHGSYVGPTLPVQSGDARVVVLAARLCVVDRTTRVDDNGSEQPFDQVIAVEYRTYAGGTAALGTEAAPDADLALAASTEGVVALAAVRLIAGQPQVAQADISYYYSNPLCVGDARTLAPLEYGAIRLGVEGETALYPSVTAATSPGTGGIVSISGDHVIRVAGRLFRSAWGAPTGVWESSTLDTSTTYFLRAQLTTKGALCIYVQKGTLPTSGVPSYTYPTDKRGTPGGSSGGEFPSTPYDILLGRITTGIAGTTPTFTPYYQGDLQLALTKPGDYSGAPVYDQTVSIPPCARDLQVTISITNEWVTATPPDASYISGDGITATVTGWSTEAIRYNAKGRWIQDNGSGLLKKTTAAFRPGVRLNVQTVRGNVVSV
jgi:hypothetical protein